MSFDWTAAATEKLRALWAEGLPTAEIGRRLGTSKNAVLGKAHRIGLLRPSPIRARQTPANKARPQRLRAAPRASEPPSEEAPVIKLLQRPTACAWPIGSPKALDFHFCGAASLPGKPYCWEHYRIAYVRRCEVAA